MDTALAPQFSANVHCDQTAGWINIPLGTEVNLGPGDVVLDRVAAPPKRSTAPSFRPMSIVAKRLDGSRCPALGMKIGLGPCHIMLDVDPTPPAAKGAPSPLFGPCLLWPRSPISATAELLLYTFWYNGDGLRGQRTCFPPRCAKRNSPPVNDPCTNSGPEVL